MVNVERFRVLPGQQFHLTSIDTNESGEQDEGSRQQIEEETQRDLALLHDLQERLYAEARQALLIVLLATDTGGKDSTTARIFSGVSPSGCEVTNFRRPTELEMKHDFLWRVHAKVPRQGKIGIFNRSHYEDVTVPRVHGDIDRNQLLRRYTHIKGFEQLLLDSGTTIRKFHLSISRDEQAERLRDRLNDPSKQWKFDPQDLKDRERWFDYQAAFEEAINATSTEDAPWYVVPADRKWFRDAVISRVVVEALQQMNPQYPPGVPNIEDYEVI